MLDNTAKSIAERAWAGEIILPSSPAEFYAALDCRVAMHHQMSVASTTVTYSPKSTGRRRVAVSMAYSYGRQHDNTVQDIPQRVAKSVEEAYNQAYDQFYLSTLMELSSIAAKFIGKIRTPNELERIAIVGNSQAHLYAMVEKLRGTASVAERRILVELLGSAAMQLDRSSDKQEPVAILLLPGFTHHTIIGEWGMAERIKSAINITALLAMMVSINHPNLNSDVRQCIEIIEAYNKRG